MNIAVIILNYKGYKNTIECINSVSASNLSKDISLKIIVVDNGSDDGSVEKLKKLQNIELIDAKDNLGYTGGNNLGIREAIKIKADYVLILNNDTYIDNNAILQLVSSSKKAEIVSPKIYFAPGFEFHKSSYSASQLGKVIWYAGGKIDWKNILGSHIGVDEVDKGQYNKEKEIDFATGASLFIKKEVFEKIGLFDDKYFLYLEDLDFSVRAKKNGFRILFEPRALVWHKNGQSAGGSGSKLQDYFISRNRLLFALKYARFKTKFAVLKQLVKQMKQPAKRRALIDLVTLNLGKGSYL